MATNMVRCSYQEIIDMHTESGHVTAVGIHTPTGSTPREMFSGFFDQFKKMKYLGASLTFVPVATLPADPSQVSYEAGEPGIDPRDLVNPIMFHGCHGDDLGGILNKLYGDNDEISSSLDGIDYNGFGGGTQTPLALTLHRLYYKALTDKTWKKAHPQKGFKKSGLRPLVYSLAANRQLGFGMEPFNAGDMNLGANNAVQVIGGDPTSNYPIQPAGNTVSFNGIQFMTPRLTSLGWIDTKNVLTSTVLLRTPQSGTATEKMEAAIADAATRQTNYTELPKIFMGVILLAPAYKTELYFRVIINHYFAFKGFRGVSFKPEVTGVPSYYDRNDDLFDINVTFPDLPNDFPGFGSDNGGDDNGGDEDEPTTLTYGSTTKFQTFDLYSTIKEDGVAKTATVGTGDYAHTLNVLLDYHGRWLLGYEYSTGAYRFYDPLDLLYINSGSSIISYILLNGNLVPSEGSYANSSNDADYTALVLSGNFVLEAEGE